MFTKRELEGYLLIDHTDSPGISAQEAAKTGAEHVPGGMKFESATINCSHCEALVVLNPKRSRSRGYCPKCDRYVCDLCEAERIKTGVCKPFSWRVDEMLKQAIKGA